MKRVIFVLVVATVLTVAVGCSSPSPSPSPAPTPTPAPTPAPAPTSVDVAKLYTVNCAACHGDKRQGMTGLAPALTPTSLAKLNEAEIRNFTLKGKPNTAMPGFEGRLSSEEIDALVPFLKLTSP